MWQKVATEMGIPWRLAETMHWQLGEQEMSARANAPVFQLHPSATSLSSPPTAPLTSASLFPPDPTTHGCTHPSPLAPMQQQHQSPYSPPPPPQPAAPAQSSKRKSDRRPLDKPFKRGGERTMAAAVGGKVHLLNN
jgi:hypothetical protein